ncbi:MAG: hypothetical protein MI919_20710 [Holophagales bacterium]|nr:hypothetical protein [Holophagales bacterium]
MVPRSNTMIAVLAIASLTFGARAETRDEPTRARLTDEQIERIESWSLEDESWWLSPQRNAEALELLSRLDAYYYAASSDEELRRAVHGDEDLFGVTVELRRRGGAPAGAVTAIVVTVEGALRPDLVLLGKITDTYAEILATGREAGRLSLERVLGRHEVASPSLAEGVLEAMVSYHRDRSLERQEERTLVLGELARRQEGRNSRADMVAALSDADKTLGEASFRAARSFIAGLDAPLRAALIAYLATRLDEIYTEQHAYAPIADRPDGLDLSAERSLAGPEAGR